MTDHCVAPPQLEDHILLLHLDGESDADVKAHLDTCSYCRSRARRFAGIQGKLRQRLHRIACPDPLELSLYQRGGSDPDPDRRTQIEAHLAICPYCRQELANLELFLDRVQDPEPVALEKESALKVFMANLISGGMTPAAAGLRGEEDDLVVFEAGDVRIVLRSRPDRDHSDRYTVTGLIAAEGVQATQVHLWRQKGLYESQQVDSSGNFRFSSAPKGEYELIAEFEMFEIHVHSLSIG